MSKAPRVYPGTSMPDHDWWSILWPNPKAILQSIGVKAGMRTLDLCCGYGHFTKSMCELVDFGKVWALDLDEALLEETAKKCQDHPSFNAILGDAYEFRSKISMPLDLVFIANTFHGVPDKIQLLRRIYQALAPSGHLAIINWHKISREETTVFEQPRGPSVRLRMTPEEVQKIAKPVGFKLSSIVDIGPYHYGICFEV